MDRLVSHFRKAHLTLLSAKTAERLAVIVKNMRRLDAGIVLGVTGFDVSALLPRRVDVTLGELRAVLSHRRVSA